MDLVLVLSRWTRLKGDKRDNEGEEDDKSYILVFGTSPFAS